MATKKAVKKTTKKPVARKTAKKTTTSKRNENAYFWGGIMIAVCAAGAFTVLAFGIGQMIR